MGRCPGATIVMNEVNNFEQADPDGRRPSKTKPPRSPLIYPLWCCSCVVYQVVYPEGISRVVSGNMVNKRGEG